MIYAKTGSGVGPIAGYIATGRSTSRRLNVFSYRKNFLLPRAIDTQPTDPSNSVHGVAWSANGEYLAVASRGLAGLKFFSRSGSALAAQTVPSNINCEDGDAAISADGTYIAAASSSAGGGIWHNDSGTLTKLTSVGTIATDSRACAASSNGQYVAFLARLGPTFLRIKERSGSGNSATYADMALADQPSSGAASGSSLAGLSFSPDNTYLAVSPTNQADQTVYKFNAGTGIYEKLASPFSGTAPDGGVRGCAFDFSGSVLAIATGNSTFFYERTGDTFSHAATVAGTVLTPLGRRGGFHPSGNFYITGTGRIYRKGATAASWTLVTSVSDAFGNAAAFSPYIL